MGPLPGGAEAKRKSARPSLTLFSLPAISPFSCSHAPGAPLQLESGKAPGTKAKVSGKAGDQQQPAVRPRVDSALSATGWGGQMGLPIPVAIRNRRSTSRTHFLSPCPGSFSEVQGLPSLGSCNCEMFGSALGNVIEGLCGQCPQVTVKSCWDPTAARPRHQQEGAGHTSRLRAATVNLNLKMFMLLTTPCKEGDQR